jgi:DNA-binding IclR family transcriptional regulator
VSGQDGSGIKSAERALTILELFSSRDRALTFTQVAETLGYPRSSLHGLLHTLTDRGWLRFDPSTRRFSLGMRAWEAGNAYRPAVDVVRGARPVVERLRQVVKGTVRLEMLDGCDTVRVLDTGDDDTVRSTAHSSGAGRVLLAGLDRTQRAEHLPEPPSDVEALHRGLDRVRADGWAGDDGADGVPSLSVPVRDAGGAVIAALGVAVPTLDPERRDDALRALQQGAEQIAAALGSQPAS